MLGVPVQHSSSRSNDHHALDCYGRDELTGALCYHVREGKLEAVPYHQEVSSTISKHMIAIVVAVRAY